MDDAEHWAPDNVLLMLQRCDDDVAAWLLAGRALAPDEVRELARHLGVDPDDDIGKVTVAVVVAARSLSTIETNLLRGFIADLRSDRLGTVQEYLRTQTSPLA